MDALILAAGLGSRLKHYTHERPKAMVKYQGIEIIKHQIDTLRSEGISRIIIVAGYKSSQLEEFLKANFNNIELITNDEYDSSNSAFSFMKAFNEIKSDKDGVIKSILVKNGEAVEFGQPLFEIS